MTAQTMRGDLETLAKGQALNEVLDLEKDIDKYPKAQFTQMYDQIINTDQLVFNGEVIQPATEYSNLEDIDVICNLSAAFTRYENLIQEVLSLSQAVEVEEQTTPAICTDVQKAADEIVKELQSSGSRFSSSNKTLHIKLSGFTRLEYFEEIVVPADFPAAEYETLVDKAYDEVDGGAYFDDPDYWDRATCACEEAD